MIFSSDMLQAVLEGRKTQTRRPVKAGEYGYLNKADPLRYNWVLTERSHIKWMTFSWYAIQPGRGKKGVGYIELTDIRREQVCDITDEDARAEGFADREGFFAKWRELYGDNADLTAWAWVLTFELVEGGEL